MNSSNHNCLWVSDMPYSRPVINEFLSLHYDFLILKDWFFAYDGCENNHILSISLCISRTKGGKESYPDEIIMTTVKEAKGTCLPREILSADPLSISIRKTISEISLQQMTSEDMIALKYSVPLCAHHDLIDHAENLDDSPIQSPYNDGKYYGYPSHLFVTHIICHVVDHPKSYLERRDELVKKYEIKINELQLQLERTLRNIEGNKPSVIHVERGHGIVTKITDQNVLSIRFDDGTDGKFDLLTMRKLKLLNFDDPEQINEAEQAITQAKLIPELQNRIHKLTETDTSFVIRFLLEEYDK